jgi:two-component system sensor histidine kinase QseC
LRSIQWLLFVSLVISAAILIALSALSSHFLNRKAVQHQIDRQLVQDTYIINILYQTDKHPSFKALRKNFFPCKNTLPEHCKNVKSMNPNTFFDYFQFQIRTKKGKVILHSPSIQEFIVSNKTAGFHSIILNKQHWRMFVLHNPQVDIAVAKRIDINDDLLQRISLNSLYIILISIPLVLFLIWICSRLALISINHLTKELTQRASNHLKPIDTHEFSRELHPVILELNKLFARLSLSFENNKRFSADAAHELRTPLAALKTQAQLTLAATEPNKQKEGIENVLIAVDHCSHIVQQLLTLSRLSHDDALTDASMFNLENLAANIIALLVPLAIEKEIEISLHTKIDSPQIKGSDTAIGILIRNLVDNAIRYTPHHGEVKIIIEKDEKHILLHVSDNGPGIPSEFREHVFKRFYRLIGTNETGSGLGLAIVKRIANLHHADIYFNKDQKNADFIITIAFPLP